MSQTHQFTIKEEVGRIDKVLAGFLPETSRSQIQQWIKEGHVTVNEKTVKSNYKVQPQDKIEIEEPEPVEMDAEPENIPLDIVYEDADVVVVNKPQGMVVHPSAGHYEGTLVNALLYHIKDLSGINGTIRPGIVHRIDKDTSGLLMVAKNDYAHERLAEQLAEKSSLREYVVLVHGEIPHKKGTIDAPIGRDPKDRKKFAVTADGKPSVTHFEVLERLDGYTLVSARLETGRTHQIRVHFDYIQHPVAGDPVYGPRKTLKGKGQFLHAKKLGFIHPRTGEELVFEADLPEVFEQQLKELRTNHR